MQIFVGHNVFAEEWIKLPKKYEFIFKKKECEYTARQEKLNKEFYEWCLKKFGEGFEITSTTE